MAARRSGRSRPPDRIRRFGRSRRFGRTRRILALAAGLLALPALLAVWLLRPPAPFEPRDRPLPPGPPPERVVVLGTSLSARNDWPAALEVALAGCLGRPVAVEVIARPGATSAWGLGQVGRVAAADPDLVIVEFAVNDADILDGLWLDRSRAAHDTLVSELRALAPEARVLLMTTNHARGPRGWARPRLAAHYASYVGARAAARGGTRRPLPALAGTAARGRRPPRRPPSERRGRAGGDPAPPAGADHRGQGRLPLGATRGP